MELIHEEDNAYDKNAVSIRSRAGRKLAYLCRADAKCVAKVFKLAKSKIMGKAKYPVEVRARARGPQQRIAIGFLADADSVDEIKNIFCLSGATVEFK